YPAHQRARIRQVRARVEADARGRGVTHPCPATMGARRGCSLSWRPPGMACASGSVRTVRPVGRAGRRGEERPALRRWLVLAVLLAGASLFPAPALAAPSGADFPLPDGHFYSEANGRGGGPGQPGFAILDRAGVPFWTVFSRGGGVA